MNTEVMQEILAYIDEHIYEKISLGELAELARYSPFYFSRLFAESMGISVTGYIRVRKLQYALSSLLEGKKVLEVSLMYAFDSHEGFTRSFTQLFGSTPSTVRKYLSAYQVPEYIVPRMKDKRRESEMNINSKEINLEDKNALLEDMHKIVFEVLRTSFEEVEAGFCSEITVILLENGGIKITDNGRGIPLSKDNKKNQPILDKIISGHPLSKLEYAQIGDFSGRGMQIVNSLCESLLVKVYRGGMCFEQDYIRGIAQHEVICSRLEHTSGMEIVLKPDTAIFGDMAFSIDRIKGGIAEKVDESAFAELWTVSTNLNEISLAKEIGTEYH